MSTTKYRYVACQIGPPWVAGCGGCGRPSERERREGGAPNGFGMHRRPTMPMSRCKHSSSTVVLSRQTKRRSVWLVAGQLSAACRRKGTHDVPSQPFASRLRRERLLLLRRSERRRRRRRWWWDLCDAMMRWYQRKKLIYGVAAVVAVASGVAIAVAFLNGSKESETSEAIRPAQSSGTSSPPPKPSGVFDSNGSTVESAPGIESPQIAQPSTFAPAESPSETPSGIPSKAVSFCKSREHVQCPRSLTTRNSRQTNQAPCQLLHLRPDRR